MPGGYEFQAVTAEWADPVVSAYAALSGADTQGYVVEVVIAGSQGDIDMLVGVDLEGSPDFTVIASAYGIPSLVLDDEDRISETLERFLGTKGSCILICEVHPDVGTND